MRLKTQSDIEIATLTPNQSGETRMNSRRCYKIKRVFQFIVFLIFRMLSIQEESIGVFSVAAEERHGRNIVAFFRCDEPIVTMFDDCSGRWTFRLDGTIEEIIDFVMKYVTHILSKDPPRFEQK